MSLRLKGLVLGEPNAEMRLVIAAQQGSREAFDALRGFYERPLRGFLSRRVGVSAVDDILQETWLAGWLSLPRYSRRARFKAWIFAIACHKCTDYYRTHTHTSSEIPLEEADETLLYQQDSFKQVELQHTVRALLSQLTDEQREVLEMYYYAELTLAEVAQALDRNLNTVKAQFYRAHARVAQEFEPAARSAKPIAERRA